MFTISDEAMKYIKKNGNNVIITMSFVPAMGG
jgi:hypothetical protein